jgi:hypothetical protein
MKKKFNSLNVIHPRLGAISIFSSKNNNKNDEMEITKVVHSE